MESFYWLFILFFARECKGYLFNTNKVENLASLIINFLNNNKPFIKKTKKAKKNFKKFTVKSCVDRYENLIDNL